MNKTWLILVVVVLVTVLAGLVVKNKFLSGPKTGALQINSTPQAKVFIDGAEKGVTPYLDDMIYTGEHLVKLEPSSPEAGVVGWEGKVTVYPGVLTAIKRQLGTSEALSSGEIVWLEKISAGDKAMISVVSTPDQATVRVDGEPKGFSPLIIENLPAGSHELALFSTGYEEKKIPAKTVSGYKLIVNVNLAQKPETAGLQLAAKGEENGASASPKPSPTPTPKSSATPKPSTTPVPTPEKPYVVIKETPTGWLRVRSQPSQTAEELTKVYPGNSFPYLNEEKYGWYKIEYEEGKEGWVSGTYSTLVK